MNWTTLSAELDSLLKLQSLPLSIPFLTEAPAGVDAFGSPMPEPTYAQSCCRKIALLAVWLLRLIQASVSFAVSSR